jgi:tetratricopeptide repeat protein 30
VSGLQNLLPPVNYTPLNQMLQGPCLSAVLLSCPPSLHCPSSHARQGNYEFGISRVIKSLEPYDTKLSTDTWFYAKRCLLSLADGLAKHMITFKEGAWEEVLGFLAEAEKHGRDIPAAYGGSGAATAGADAGKAGGAAAVAAAADRTVAAEARMIKRVLLRLRDE